MKIKIVLLFVFASIFTAFAQTSDKGFSFQGFAIDPDGKALGATAITVKFTVSPSAGTGGNYAETHALTTDPFGVFHATIGKGAKESGSDDFKTLDFTRNGTIYKLKVEVKKTAGGIYTTINETDFNAVPYARKAENGVPVGTIVAFAGPKTKIPSGWALCDGSQRDGSSVDWKQLYETIGTSWGGSGTTFNLPDLRGMFVRGVNDGRTDSFKDPDATSRTAIKPGGNTGDNVGSVQTDQTKAHNHGVSDPGHNHSINDPGHSHGIKTASSDSNGDANDYGDNHARDNRTYSSTTGITINNNTTGITIQNTGGAETRPINAGVYYIIKY